MGRAKPNQPKGLIEKHVSLQHFDLTLVTPSAALERVVANYWIIEWDLPKGRAYAQENLPHASQHLVLDPQYQSGVFGLTSGAFTYHLQGKGRVFGVKFHPGQFRRFAAHDMRNLTDHCVPVSSYFDVDDHELLRGFCAAKHCADFAPTIELMLLNCEIKEDAKAKLAQEVVEFIEVNREIFEVAVVAQHFHVSPRALQRLFAEYVGIGPKWVIERYRMIEAIEALNNSSHISLTELSHALGYFDQAHFSKAFKRLTGRRPTEIGLPPT
ncbi:helix-turn-helix domain-containing protein [uncultured Maritalea sp.]|jgi:AraC-like DNA-binding protein|uniref:AraC family transcriptional regulator n=1 Tax=uncultured Maritalea sp. TaxID=757249 RepID=UPI0026076A37|nr:helix-turn-helix domain-containing protein [uncultured Maritalea sp.]